MKSCLPATSVIVALAGALWMNTAPQAVADSNSAASARGAWTNGPFSDPNRFPIAVWLQSPDNAQKYKDAGINLYIGLWQGPMEAQLTALKAAGMPVICEQNAVGIAHKTDKTIVGWMHSDEPDNAQPITDPATSKPSWGSPVPPAQIVARYQQLRAADPTRPILLNLGQGVANDAWKGRGSGAKLEDYLTYVKGGDIVSFDVYPVSSLDDGANNLWYVPKGIDRLKSWSGGQDRIWNCIEASRIDNEKVMVSPEQIRAEVWMSLIHGSTGLVYFVHQFKPTFNEHALLDDPILLPAVAALNRQIQSLAPVLNSPTIKDGASVKASTTVPIDTMVKRQGNVTYVFGVGMRNAATHGSFEVPSLGAQATAEVLGENRRLTVQHGHFEDDFKPYDVHLYRITR